MIVRTRKLVGPPNALFLLLFGMILNVNPVLPAGAQDLKQLGSETELEQLETVLTAEQAIALKGHLDAFRSALLANDRKLVDVHLADGFTAFGQSAAISDAMVLGQFLQQGPKIELSILTVFRKEKSTTVVLGNPKLKDFKLKISFNEKLMISNFNQYIANSKTVDPKKDGTADSADPTIKALVTITHTGPDSWIFNYDFSKQLTSLFFGPKTERYHQSSWNLPDDFHFVIEGPYSYLERKDGKSFKQVRIDVKTYRAVVMYAPQPFVVFESGTAVNTYALGLAARIGKARMMMTYKPEFRFLGFRDEIVVIPGHPVGSTEKIPKSPFGRFVYFGSRSSVVETQEIYSVLDTDFPDKLVGTYLRSTNAFAELYNKELGRANSGKLNIFVSYERDSRRPGMNFSGGAQGDAIAAKVSGKYEIDRHDKLVLRLNHFLAHEMGHIWQARLGKDDTRWFAEGEAEILSLHARHKLGLMTSQDVAADLTSRVPKCLQFLEKTALVDSHVNGYPQANYEGGALVLAAAIAAAAADGQQDDVFALDRELKKMDTDQLKAKPLESFLAALRNLGATESACQTIKVFITERNKDPRTALIAMLEATGIAYSMENNEIKILASSWSSKARSENSAQQKLRKLFGEQGARKVQSSLEALLRAIKKSDADQIAAFLSKDFTAFGNAVGTSQSMVLPQALNQFPKNEMSIVDVFQYRTSVCVVFGSSPGFKLQLLYNDQFEISDLNKFSTSGVIPPEKKSGSSLPPELFAPTPVDNSPVAPGVRTNHQGIFNGQPVSYDAITEETVLNDKDGNPAATVFSTSYLRTNAGKAGPRAVLFVFNGGPGASSLPLHLGIGPIRTPSAEDSQDRFVENKCSVLDAVDLVFVDPPGTGYSRNFKKNAGRIFFSTDQDADAILSFVFHWLARENRADFCSGKAMGPPGPLQCWPGESWNSPKK